MTTDNAASRLLSILNKAKEIDKNTQSSRAWKEVLQTTDSALLLSRLGKVIALPEDISAALSNRVETNRDVIQHISRQFFVAYSSHKFSDKWEVFVSKIDNHMLNYLSLASTLLETQVRTRQLEDRELEEIRLDILDILDKSRNSELPPRVKAYLVSHLHEIISALDDYFITGAEPVLTRIEATLGHAHIDSEYKGFLRDDELGERLLESLAAAANLVTVAVGLPHLANAILLLQQS